MNVPTYVSAVAGPGAEALTLTPPLAVKYCFHPRLQVEMQVQQGETTCQGHRCGILAAGASLSLVFTSSPPSPLLGSPAEVSCSSSSEVRWSRWSLQEAQGRVLLKPSGEGQVDPGRGGKDGGGEQKAPFAEVCPWALGPKYLHSHPALPHLWVPEPQCPHLSKGNNISLDLIGLL